MPSPAYKFANEVLPLLLAEQAMQRDPVAPSEPPLPEVAPTPLPEEPAAEELKAASFEAQLVQLVLEKNASIASAARAAYHAAGRGLAAVGRGVVGSGNFVGNVGRGAFAVTKPLTGLATGGLRGAGRGVAAAGQSIAAGGAPAALGAGLALYGGYNTLRNPIIADGTGVRFRSPVHIPAMRFRPPITASGTFDGSGFRVQNPVKVLW